jgi:hypothetical protein
MSVRRKPFAQIWLHCDQRGLAVFDFDAFYFDHATLRNRSSLHTSRSISARTQTGKCPDCPNTASMSESAPSSSRTVSLTERISTSVSRSFAALHVRHGIFGNVTTSFGKTEKYGQPPPERVARDCADTQAAQPFVNLIAR